MNRGVGGINYLVMWYRPIRYLKTGSRYLPHDPVVRVEGVNFRKS
jgi:hypothetical protein